MNQWSMALPQGAQEILNQLYDAGYEGYAVGGCVRDVLLGRQPKDYDLCTDASPEQMQRVFADRRVIKTGIAHGTLTIVAAGEMYEVTTYRVDGEYADHRHPESVSFVREVARDLARRDFTVNAMAYSPRDGLKDCFGGQQDLKDGVIRCVGDARRRFNEDALRILRALRFAAVYGFSIEKGTADAAREYRMTLVSVAKERITAELSRMVCGDAAERILTEFADVMGAVLPCTLHAQGLSSVPKALEMRLAHLMQDAGDAKEILHRALRLDRGTMDAALVLLAHREECEPASRAEWKQLLRSVGAERARQLAQWKKWNTAALEDVLQSGECWHLGMLAVTGRDLIAAGCPAGRGMGKMLESLLDRVILQQLPNQKEALIAAAIEQRG